MYSVTDRASFEAVDNWYKDVMSRGDDRVSMVLLGSKCDNELERQVTVGEGAAAASRLGIPFFEVSSKTDKNVHVAVDLITDMVLVKIEEGKWDPHCARAAQGRAPPVEPTEPQGRCTIC
jgi:GTPase SAR1 family protein